MQNLSPGLSGAPQFRQNAPRGVAGGGADAACMGVPQTMQNLLPGEAGLPQFGQTLPAAAGAAGAGAGTGYGAEIVIASGHGSPFTSFFGSDATVRCSGRNSQSTLLPSFSVKPIAPLGETM